MRQYHVWLAGGALAVLLSAPAVLGAQGFSVNEHSACAMGRAGTAVAAPCDDGSAMFFNPAGLAQAPKGRTQISVGGTFIAPSGGFTQDATGLKSDLEDRVFPVPALYLSRGVSDRIAVGLGVFAPYGLETDWPKTALGRFSSYNSIIRNIYVQPTVAARLGDKVKIGAGFDVNFLHLELQQRIDLSEQNTTTPGVTFANLGIPDNTDFADATISGSKTTFGFHAGIIVEPTKDIAFGVRYLSRQKGSDIDGDVKIQQVNTGILIPPGSPLIGALGVPAGTPLDAVLATQFQAGGPLVDQGGATSVRLPEQLSLGVAVRLTPKFRVLADYTMQNWEVWETIILDFDILPTETLPQNFGKAHGWRFGGEYNVGEASVVRLGFLTHNAAAPDETVTSTLPEASRTEFTAGFGTRLGGSGHVDVAYQYIDQADRRGRSGGPGTVNDGIYTFKAHLFGATFTWNF